MRCRCCMITVALLLSVSHLSCRASGPKGSEHDARKGTSDRATSYTAYNLWYEVPERMFGINYRRGAMIPAGTEVSAWHMKDSRDRPIIEFTTAGKGRTYTIYFRKKFCPGLTAGELENRLLTNEPFEQLTKGLTAAEIQSIKKGKLEEGMSKRSVLIARGYPPGHRTPSLDDNTWLYWENRFMKQAVRFGEDGRVSEIIGAGR